MLDIITRKNARNAAALRGVNTRDYAPSAMNAAALRCVNTSDNVPSYRITVRLFYDHHAGDRLREVADSQMAEPLPDPDSHPTTLVAVSAIDASQSE